jgi:pimeloyl-ACP methyl ester carboxylesterase
MPGHGLSDGVDYSDRDLRPFQTGLFAALLTGLGLTHVAVVGNSLGGMTALWLALDAGDLVSRVVILGVPATALPGARPDLLLSLLSVATHLWRRAQSGVVLTANRFISSGENTTRSVDPRWPAARRGSFRERASRRCRAATTRS